MSLILSLLAGLLFAASTYLLLGRGRLEALVGFALLTNAANLAILAASGWSPAQRPPILAPAGREAPSAATAPVEYADPVPQALALTAIVIGFALTGFAMAMAARLAELEAKEAPRLTGTDAGEGGA